MTARLPTTVMPVVSRAGSFAFGVTVRSVPSPTIAFGPTITSLSRIARSTTAPARITESNITIESRTIGARIDAHARRQHGVRSTVPSTTQPWRIRLDGRCAVGPMRAGGALLRARVDQPVAVVEVERRLRPRAASMCACQ